MSTWKELPKPATPGPWSVDHLWEVALAALNNDPDVRRNSRRRLEQADFSLAFGDAAAIAALPEYVAEVERLRAVIDWLVDREFKTDMALLPQFFARIRAGEWPEGRQP